MTWDVGGWETEQAPANKLPHAIRVGREDARADGPRARCVRQRRRMPARNNARVYMFEMRLRWDERSSLNRAEHLFNRRMLRAQYMGDEFDEGWLAVSGPGQLRRGGVVGEGEASNIFEDVEAVTLAL